MQLVKVLTGTRRRAHYAYVMAQLTLCGYAVAGRVPVHARQRAMCQRCERSASR